MRVINWLDKLAVSWLIKRRITVMVNVKVIGDVQFLTSKVYIYKNVFSGRVFEHGGSRFRVPQGKFHIVTRKEK